ncbi:MAG: NADH-quinone oxidoreductase subunit L [Halobacteria archaeon]
MADETIIRLIPVIPLVSFVILLLGGMFPKKKGLGRKSSVGIGVIATGVSLLLSIQVLYDEFFTHGLNREVVTELVWVTGQNIPHLKIGLLVDPLSVVMIVVVTLVSFLVHVFSYSYMNKEGETGLPRYYAELSFFTASMLFFVLANNVLMAFIFFELVGLASYLLIGFWYETPSAASAAKKAFLVTRFGDYFFLVGVVGIFAAFGTFEFGPDGFAGVAEKMMHRGDTILGLSPAHGITLIGVLVLGGVIGKSAQFPLQTWLPEAMEGPTPVSALIHAATMVAAGVSLIARMYHFFSLSGGALLFMGGFTALYAASLGTVQDDLKGVLAYSTISQYGYMMLALGAGGYASAIFHLMNHAFFKALLFLGAGSVIIATHHTKNMWKLGGLSRRMKVTYATFLAGSFSLAGIIPFAGFWSKDEILASAYANATHAEPLLWIPFAMGMLGVLFTGFYTFRMVTLTFTGEPRSDHARTASENGWTVKFPLIVLAILAVLAGFVGAKPLGIHTIEHFLVPDGRFMHRLEESVTYTEADVNYLVTGSALVLAFVGTIGGYLAYRGEPRKRKEGWGFVGTLLEKRYYFNDFQVWLAEGFTLQISIWSNEFDLEIIDGTVNAVSDVSLGTGGALRRVQDGVVAHYAAIITFGVVSLLFVVGVAGGWF